MSADDVTAPAIVAIAAANAPAQASPMEFDFRSTIRPSAASLHQLVAARMVVVKPDYIPPSRSDVACGIIGTIAQCD
jgi:hypothetical protein